MIKLNWGYTPMLALLGSASFFSQADAAGFMLRETSASYMGSAFAGYATGKAVGDADVTSMFVNPSTMTHFDKGHQTALSASLILPNIKFTNNGSGTTGDNGGNAMKPTVIPAAYLMVSATDKLKFGLAATVPWGLKTEYNRNWIGRHRAVRSEIQTMNLTPSVAYKVNQWFSIGAGLQIQYMKAKLSNMLGANLVDTQASDWSYGATLGMIFEPTTTTRFGMGYRSQITHRLEGKANAENNAGGLNTAGARANIQTPESITVSMSHDFTPTWTVMADASWVHWSRLQDLKLYFTRQNLPQFQSTEDLKWRDTIFLSLGTHYKFCKDWKVKLGFAYDQSPVSDSRRTPRLPDSDRYWVSTGVSYEWNHLMVDLSYSHIFAKNASINLAAVPATGTPSLAGSYKASLDLIGLQARYRF